VKEEAKGESALVFKNTLSYAIRAKEEKDEKVS
jgi:hypothetical protein